MKNLGIQLYTVRGAAKTDYRGILEKIVEFGYTAVEPAGYPGTTAQQAAAWYKEMGLSVPSVHSALPVGDNRDRVIAELRALGCRDLITGFGPKDFETLDAARRVCDAFNAAAKTAHAEGLRIGYHNHWWEFREIPGSDSTGYDMLIDGCDPAIFFELDTYWAKVGGSDPVEIIGRLGERCAYLHVKDGPGVRDVPNTAVGDGCMHWPSVFTAARHCSTIFVEMDHCATPILDAVRNSASYLIKEGLVNGN